MVLFSFIKVIYIQQIIIINHIINNGNKCIPDLLKLHKFNLRTLVCLGSNHFLSTFQGFLRFQFDKLTTMESLFSMQDFSCMVMLMAFWCDF